MHYFVIGLSLESLKGLALRRGEKMTYYRLYFMSRGSGHIERYEDFEAADDLMAVRAGRAVAGVQPLELWCEHRKVQRFEVHLEAN